MEDLVYFAPNTILSMQEETPTHSILTMPLGFSGAEVTLSH